MTIPGNLRIPFVAVEFDATQANQGPALLQYQAVMIGQKLAAGSATANSLVRATSVDDVIELAGRGSHLHEGAKGWFANNKFTPLYLGILADDVAGVQATGTITVTGPATEDGTIALYLGGDLVTVGVNSGDTATDIGDAIETAVNDALDLPVTAANAAGVVTLTFRHKGVIGNTYDVRYNYRDGDELPAGVALAIVAMGAVVAGTTTPVMTTLIAAMSNFWFQEVIHSYNDATSLTALETELEDRWGPMRQKDGLAISAAAGSFATLTTLGSGRNSKQSTIFAQPGINPLRSPIRFAAACSGVMALAAQEDPGRPFQTLEVADALAPAEADRFDDSERNLLLYDGISTTKVGPGDVVQLERPITTYETSPAGADDESYLDVTTRFTLLYLRYTFRTRMQTRYPRHKLANDGTRFGAGQKVMTPKLGKAEAIGWFEDMEALGLVEDVDQFKRDLVVARSLTNTKQLDFLLPPNLIDQLIVTAATIQFRR